MKMVPLIGSSRRPMAAPRSSHPRTFFPNRYAGGGFSLRLGFQGRRGTVRNSEPAPRPQPPKVPRRPACRAGKGRVRTARSFGNLHLVQIWLAARPGTLRTPCGPVPAWFWILQEATYPLPRSYVEPVQHLLLSCGLQGSATSRPREERPQEVDLSKIWLSFSPTGSGARKYALENQSG